MRTIYDELRSVCGANELRRAVEGLRCGRATTNCKRSTVQMSCDELQRTTQPSGVGTSTWGRVALHDTGVGHPERRTWALLNRRATRLGEVGNLTRAYRVAKN